MSTPSLAFMVFNPSGERLLVGHLLDGVIPRLVIDGFDDLAGDEDRRVLAGMLAGSPTGVPGPRSWIDSLITLEGLDDSYLVAYGPDLHLLRAERNHYDNYRGGS